MHRMNWPSRYIYGVLIYLHIMVLTHYFTSLLDDFAHQNESLVHK